MAKLVYKGKINGNDVVYKEGCFHGPFDRLEGAASQNIMEVVTETGRKFRFRAYSHFNYILDCLAKNRDYLYDDHLNEVIIKEKGKKTLSYNSRNTSVNTARGKRTELVFEKANKMYNEIKNEILKELKEQYSGHSDKPKNKKLENLIMTEDKEKQIKEEVEDVFNIDLKKESLYLYKGYAKRFIEIFSKIEDKDKKKELLDIIFRCDYENKEVIEWLNKNEQDLLRETGFNS